jgi:hypothetical protein
MKSRGIAFDRRPSQFVRRAEKTFRLPRMITGLPTDERCLDLSEQDSGQRGEATGAAAQITPVAYDLGHSDRLASSSSWALVARLPAASFSARRRRSSSIFRRLKPMPGWLTAASLCQAERRRKPFRLQIGRPAMCPKAGRARPRSILQSPQPRDGRGHASRLFR